MKIENKIAIIFFGLLFAFPVYFKFVYERSKVQQAAPIPSREEMTITIIPGWDLRDIAEYFVKVGLVSSTKDFLALTGKPAVTDSAPYKFENKILESKKASLSLEGYLAPETYRIFKDAKPVEVVDKLIAQREKELNSLEVKEVNWHEIITMASLIEDEARSSEDRRIVSDILSRRLGRNWALQLDSTVHYVVDSSGTVFTTENERKVDSYWNTYKYPGLPPGPICSPSLDSIEAALNPAKNDYWYFLSGNDGKMHYAKTLEEHTANRYKYLK